MDTSHSIKPTPHGSATVELRGVSLALGRQQILNELSMRVPRGSVYELLGRNGSGKSTAFKLILGLLRPNSSDVLIAGEPWTRASLESVGASVNGPALYEHLSALDNLRVHQALTRVPTERLHEVKRRGFCSDPTEGNRNMPEKKRSELRERVIRMVLERQAAQRGPRSQPIRAVAPQLGVSEETLRMWCQRHGHEIATASAAETPAEQIRRLKRELAEARRANEILTAASAFSQPSWAAPRRDDPVHPQAPRSVRGRGHLSRAPRERVWVHHLPRLPGGEDAPCL